MGKAEGRKRASGPVVRVTLAQALRLVVRLNAMAHRIDFGPAEYGAEFWAYQGPVGLRVRCACRDFSVAAAREHWRRRRSRAQTRRFLEAAVVISRTLRWDG